MTLLFPGPVDTAIVRAGRATDIAKRDAEAAFLARRGVSAAYVAKRCLRGVERNRARVVVSLDYRLIDLCSRVAPTLTLWAVTRLAPRLPF